MAFISMFFVVFLILMLGVAAVMSLVGCVCLVVYLVKRRDGNVRGFLTAAIILLSLGLPFLTVGGAFFAWAWPEQVPETITVDGVEYKTGFYGDLYPSEITYESDTPVWGDSVYRVSGSLFSMLYYADDTSYEDERGMHGGTLYCRTEDFDAAMAYYSAPENLCVGCIKGQYTDKEAWTVWPKERFPVSELDRLYAFSEAGQGEMITRVCDANMLDEEKLVLYKRSEDGIFETGDAFHSYYIIDGKLYLFYEIVDWDEYSDQSECVFLEIPQKIADPILARLVAAYLG